MIKVDYCLNNTNTKLVIVILAAIFYNDIKTEISNGVYY